MSEVRDRLDVLNTAGNADLPDRFLLQWHLTERCNCRCTHCYQHGLQANELNFDQWLGVLRQYDLLLDRIGQARGRGPIHGHLTLTGGEPLMHRDLFSLLHHIAHRPRRSFAILTNGMLIDAAAAGELARLGTGFVQVSIEGDRVMHNRIRGVGAYEAALRGIEHLVDAGVPAIISFTAHRLNYRLFPVVAALGRKLGVQRVWADRLVPLGQAAAMGEMTLGPARLAEFLQIMRQEQARSLGGRTEIAMQRALQFLVGDGAPYRCTAGRSLLTLLPDGQVVPCRRMPIAIGNLLRTSLANLYFENPCLAELRRPRIAGGCERCFYASECGGGARCQSWATSGDPYRADPDCWMARKMSVAQIRAQSCEGCPV